MTVPKEQWKPLKLSDYGTLRHVAGILTAGVRHITDDLIATLSTTVRGLALMVVFTPSVTASFRSVFITHICTEIMLLSTVITDLYYRPYRTSPGFAGAVFFVCLFVCLHVRLFVCLTAHWLGSILIDLNIVYLYKTFPGVKCNCLHTVASFLIRKSQCSARAKSFC